MGTTKLFFHSLRDLLVLTAILAGVNALLDRGDPGWMGLNPTPWLLPAALIGARYGFTSGLVSGLVVAAFLAGVKSRMQGLDLEEMLREHAYFYLSVVVTGAAAGEIGRLLSRRSAVVKETNRRLEEENARIRAQLHLTDETRHQLQQQLVLFNAPMCALDDELSTLFTYPQEEFAHQLLRVLHRLTGLTSAGIYVADGNTLTQTSVLHATPPLVASLSLGETPLAAQALSSGALASVPEATELTEAQPFLAAFPWLDHVGRTSVLLIQDMPLEAYSLQNLARLELILSWASAIAVLRQTFMNHAGGDHMASNDDFIVLLSEALEAERVHSLPSTVLRLDFDGADGLRGALRQLPNTAVSTRINGITSAAVLLPFSGETEALQVRRAIAASTPTARAQHYLISGGITAQDLWATLQNS